MRHSAVAIGTFDGLHRGHRYLINQLIEIAQQRQLSSVVITLERPVRPVPGVLTTLEEKIELLRQLPIDKIVVLPVSPEIIDQPASVFLNICSSISLKYGIW
jgi:riboflavin kinase/FMN adenylyltransferase